MKKLLSFAAAFLLISLSGCIKQPVACIDVSTTECYTDEVVSFTDCSTDAVSWEWSFSDGGYFTTQDVDYTFTSSGSKTVQLKVYSKKDKKVDATTVTIQVTQATGQVSFWQSGTPLYDDTEVTIQLLFSPWITKNITSYYPNGISDCVTSGCANFTLDVGTYWYSAENWSPPLTSWSDYVTVTKDGCLIVKLN